MHSLLIFVPVIYKPCTTFYYFDFLIKFKYKTGRYVSKIIALNYLHFNFTYFYDKRIESQYYRDSVCKYNVEIFI